LSLEIEIPFESEEGHQYLISFREFPTNQTNYSIPLIDTSITLMSSKVATNSLKTLNSFIKIVLDYLEKNDVIIYYYCDTSPINIRQTRKQNFSNQEFRFLLFELMFNKLKSEDYYLQNIIISDNVNGNHYTSLISRTANKDKIELVKLDIEKLNK
jgi:hypothetical protein